jgi:hypothetical protein
MRGLPPTKKRRLAESTFLFTPVAEDRTKAQDQKGSQFPWANRGGARPSHDSIGDAEFRQHVFKLFPSGVAVLGTTVARGPEELR